MSRSQPSTETAACGGLIPVTMARRHFDPAVVDARLQELAAHEAKVVAEPPHLPRLHAGWGDSP